MTSLNRRALLGGAAATAGLALSPFSSLARAQASPGLALARPTLTHGTQVGDPVGGQATLWSRADRPARLVAELSPDPAFRHVRRVRGPVVTPQTDLTGTIGVRGLPGGEEVHYRITAVDLDDHRATSEPLTGSFRTGVTGKEDIRFIWSGDICGQGWGVNPDLGGFRIAPAMKAAGADFFLSSGDNVYSDGPVKESVTLPDGRVWHNVVTPEKQQVAQTLDQYRGQFRYNLLADNWRDFLSSTAIIAQWDDHEVLNNWYPGEVLNGVAGYPDGTQVDTLAARARQAFHEYIPVGSASPDRAGRVYRKLSFGPLMDLFILDMRTHKDPNTANLETDDDAGVLGREQTEWLVREMGRSKATWKVVANDLPLGLVVPDGKAQESISNADNGAPLGREHELAHVLSSLKKMGVKNHVWLTADVHYTAAHHYSPERAAFTDFDEFWEFVSGPLNAGAFGPNDLDDTFGPSLEFVAAPTRQGASPMEGFQFFGQVDIDADSEELTVTLKDVEGAALFTKVLSPQRR